jgi:type VI secretion system protein ImpG
LAESGGDQLPRVLAEYSYFPEKFAFVELDMPALIRCAGVHCKQLTLYIVLPNYQATQLRQTSPKNLRLSCAPVINLAQQPAQATKVDGVRDAYQVVPSVPGSDIYSIDKVALLTASGARILPPFHGTDHSAAGPFWQLDEQEGCAIKLVDRNQQPATFDTGTIHVDLTCMNDQVPRQSIRLATQSSIGTFPISLARAPTLPRRFAEPGKLCAALYAVDTSLTTIKELFKLHDCAQAEAFLHLSHKPATAWIKHPGGLIHMDGNEYTLMVDEAALRDHSMSTLAAILAMVLAARTYENRFIQLCLVTQDAGLLLRTGPHIGQRKIA